jgi:RiboL-PSP-HEPN
VSELFDVLAGEIAWRKKELVDLKYLIETGAGHGSRQRVLCRSGVAMLYAHWEGFVTKAGTLYLNFVCMQRLPHGELKDNFLSVLLKHEMDARSGGRKASALGWVTEFFLYELGERSYVPYKTAIDTESNLSSKVFREIVWCLGIDYGPFEPSEKILDSRLLGKRNHIAHGEELDVDTNEYLELHERVMGLMEAFRAQLENAALLVSYKRAA